MSDKLTAFYQGWDYLKEIVAAVSISKNWDPPSIENIGEKIALVHSELSEALEAARLDDPPSNKIPEFTGMEEEFADTIIRIMHISQALNLRVEQAIPAKIKYNKTRPVKHGGKRF